MYNSTVAQMGMMKKTSKNTVTQGEEILQLYVVFLQMDKSAKKFFMNRAAAWYSASDFFHCELYFPKQRQTVTIDAQNPIYFVDDKNYIKKPWQWIAIDVTISQYNQAYALCKEIEGRPFDKFGLFTFMCPHWMFEVLSLNKWICSKLCCVVLQKIGVLSTDITPSKITPGGLKTALDDIAAESIHQQKRPTRRGGGIIKAAAAPPVFGDRDYCRVHLIDGLPKCIKLRILSSDKERTEDIFTDDRKSMFYHAEEENSIENTQQAGAVMREVIQKYENAQAVEEDIDQYILKLGGTGNGIIFTRGDEDSNDGSDEATATHSEGEVPLRQPFERGGLKSTTTVLTTLVHDTLDYVRTGVILLGPDHHNTSSDDDDDDGWV